MIERVQKTIGEYSMLAPGRSLLLAVSGGADSTALLHAMKELQKDYALTLFAAHVNHGIRRAASRDEQFVRELCGEQEIELFVRKVDVPNLARAEKISIELAARNARYAFFEEILAARGIDCCATAHTADDSAETALYHFIRGAGLKGLRGIPPVRGKFIRPLIGCSRAEIEAYLLSRRFAWVEDETNQKTDYTRNKIRHFVLPELEKINPNFKKGISRAAKILSNAQDFIEVSAKEEFDRIAQVGENRVAIPLSRYDALHPALRREVFLQAAKRLGIEEPFPFDRFLEIEDMISRGSVSKKKELHKGAVVRIGYGEIILERAEKNDPDGFFCEKLDLPRGEIFSKNKKYRITFEIEGKNTVFVQKKLNIARLDCGRIKSDLCVRGKKPGDKYRPAGFSGHKSLKKMMIDQKIPQGERQEIPVFECGGEIVWVYGFPVAEGYEPQSGAKEVLKIIVSEENGCF